MYGYSLTGVIFVTFSLGFICRFVTFRLMHKIKINEMQRKPIVNCETKDYAIG